MTAAELAEAGIFGSVILIAIPVHPSIPIQWWGAACLHPNTAGEGHTDLMVFL